MNASATFPCTDLRLQRRSAKRRRRALTLALLFAVLVAVVVLVVKPRPVFTMARTSAPAVVRHRVSVGDTLWEIAAQYSGQQDVRKLIAAIRETNHLKSSEIHPGQVLLVPIARR